MKKEKYLILGISSFSGASMAEYLLKKNKLVYGTYRNKKIKPYLPFRFYEEKTNKAKLIKIDILKDGNKLINYIKKIKPDYIIDFASICMVEESWANPKKYFEINLTGKINLIQSLNKLKNFKKYIYISTPEIFGSSNKNIKENCSIFAPNTPYANSKLSYEFLINSFAKNFNLPIIITRFSNFYGPGQPAYRLIPKIILSIKKGMKFPIQGSGNSKRNFIFSEDFCNGILKTIKKGKKGNIYHFSGKELYSVKEVIKKVCKIMKTDYKRLVYFKKDRVGKDKQYLLDCVKTRKDLAWKPVIKFDKGIRETINYINKNLSNFKKMPLNFKFKL